MRLIIYCAFIVAAFLVRFTIAVNNEPLWYDESFSVVLAGLPLDRLIAATAGDVHPPLYYMALKLWTGSNSVKPIEMNARFLSFLLMAVCGLIYARLLSRLSLSETEVDIAMLLYMWLPGLTFFSAEARMYALLCPLLLGAILCLWRSESPFISVELAYSIAGGVLIGMACLTHNVGLIYAPVVAVSAFVFRVRRGVPTRKVIYGLMLCAGVAMIVYSPWAGVLIQQTAATSKDGYWNAPPRGLGTVAYNLYMALCYGITSTGPDSAAMLIVAAITTAGVVFMVKHDYEALIMIGGVLGLMAIVSYITGTGVMLHRALLPLNFMLIIGWARVIARQRAVAVPVAMVCAFGAAFMLANGRQSANYDLWRNLPTQTGDIIYANNSAAVPLLIYTDMPIAVAWQDKPMATGLSQETLHAIGIPMMRLDALKWQRAWFAWFDVPYTTEAERIYRDEIISAYDGKLVWSNHDPFFNSELWLLQNGTHR